VQVSRPNISVMSFLICEEIIFWYSVLADHCRWNQYWK
jgi:hypothetical protein